MSQDISKGIYRNGNIAHSNVNRIPKWKLVALASIALPSATALSVSGGLWLGSVVNAPECRKTPIESEVDKEYCANVRNSQDLTGTIAQVGMVGLASCVVVGGASSVLNRRNTKSPITR